MSSFSVELCRVGLNSLNSLHCSLQASVTEWKTCYMETFRCVKWEAAKTGVSFGGNELSKHWKKETVHSCNTMCPAKKRHLLLCFHINVLKYRSLLYYLGTKLEICGLMFWIICWSRQRHIEICSEILSTYERSNWGDFKKPKIQRELKILGHHGCSQCYRGGH